MYLKRCVAGGMFAAALTMPPMALPHPSGPQQSAGGSGCKEPSPARTARAPADGAASTRAVAGFGTTATADRLERARGGSDNTAVETKLDGTVGGNTASQVVTGDNLIQSGSFANASGIPIVIQNSGANVLIQNATVINLQLK
jgi:hypothetical protein